MADTTAQQPPVPKPTGRKTRVISGLITLTVLVLVFAFLLPKFGNYAEAWTYIQEMPAWSLALLTFAILLNVFVYVWPFMAALPGIAYGPAFVVRQTSFMISNTVPAGGALGLAVQYGMLGSYGIGPAPTTSAIAINSIWNLLATVAMPMVGALALVVTGEMTSHAAVAGAASLAIVAVSSLLLWIVIRSEPGAERVGSWLDRLAAWGLRIVRKPSSVDVKSQVLKLRHSVEGVVRRRWLELSISNLAMQFTAWFVLFVALRGIQAGAGDVTVTWSESLAAFSLSRLATFIPVTPGGLGTVDAALTALLVGYGATNSEALAATLVWRAGTFIPQVLLGVATFLWWRLTSVRRKARLAATPNG